MTKRSPDFNDYVGPPTFFNPINACMRACMLRWWGLEEIEIECNLSTLERFKLYSMSAQSTPQKAMKPVPSSPARSIRSTPGKSPHKSPSASSTAGTPLKVSRPSSVTKASDEGSWNLEESNGKDINLETNVVNKNFQINKQLYSKGGEYDLDVEEEARLIEKRTIERLESQAAAVEAFQTKTTMRAEALTRANKNSKQRIGNRGEGKKTSDSATTSADDTSSMSRMRSSIDSNNNNNHSNSSKQLIRPGTAPASTSAGNGCISRRDAIILAKAAELASYVKPLVKKTKLTKASKRAAATKAEEQAFLAAAAAKTKELSEREAKEARQKAAYRAKISAEREVEKKALSILREAGKCNTN